MCLNPEHRWKVGFDGDKDVYDIRYTLIHEIGHAIGLDHPGPSGQLMGFRYTEDFAELQPGDLKGVRQLYGRGGEENVLAIGADPQLSTTPARVYLANDLTGHSEASTSEEKRRF